MMRPGLHYRPPTSHQHFGPNFDLAAMRHGVAFNRLSRTTSHRDLMLRNMVSSLIEHEQIQTTFAKAKEAARVAEGVITWGKTGRLAQMRRAEGFLMVRSLISVLIIQLFLECTLLCEAYGCRGRSIQG